MQLNPEQDPLYSKRLAQINLTAHKIATIAFDCSAMAERAFKISQLSKPEVQQVFFKIMLLHEESNLSKIALTKTEYSVLYQTIRLAVYYSQKQLSPELIELLDLLVAQVIQIRNDKLVRNSTSALFNLQGTETGSKLIQLLKQYPEY